MKFYSTYLRVCYSCACTYTTTRASHQIYWTWNGFKRIEKIQQFLHTLASITTVQKQKSFTCMSASNRPAHLCTSGYR